MHKNIFNMVTYGHGGWTWGDLYQLPVFLRNFYIKQMSAAFEKQSTPPTSKKVKSRPQINPTS